MPIEIILTFAIVLIDVAIAGTIIHFVYKRMDEREARERATL